MMTRRHEDVVNRKEWNMRGNNGQSGPSTWKMKNRAMTVVIERQREIHWMFQA